MAKKVTRIGNNAKAGLTKPERTRLLRSLKARALDGDVSAAMALSNLELAVVTKQRLELDLDRVA